MRDTDTSRSAARRDFLKRGSLLCITTPLVVAGQVNASDPVPPRGQVRWAMMTDVHYADKKPAGTRFYRDSLAKMQAVQRTLGELQLDFVIELGDLIDAATSAEVEREYLQTILKPLSGLPGKNYYVLGNHCVQTLSKSEFLNEVKQPRSFFSFNVRDVHFIVLDACFRSDGKAYDRGNFQWTDANIPEHELQWLVEDLKRAVWPTILFVHQRLDVENQHGIKNAAKVRRVLEESKKVQAVFQGHSHENDHRSIGGVEYVTLAAMVEKPGLENNAFAMVDVTTAHSLSVKGFKRQADANIEGRPHQD